MTEYRKPGIRRVRIILNMIIAMLAIGAWLVMVFARGGLLTDTGLRSLKYFTVLSNIFEGIACIIWIVTAVSPGGDSGRMAGAEKVKYMAAVSVALTFMTVMIFLGPLYGYAAMLAGPNFFLHMLVPVLAILECIFLADAVFTRRDNMFAVLPMVLYGAVYLANNLINGTGEWPHTYDWYGFLNWGLPVGLAIFAGLCLVTWLAGAAMRLISNYFGRKKTEKQ